MAADVEACRASHAALVTHLQAVTAADPPSPSLLPGWSIGHVLTHFARNADGHLCMLAGLAQYPDGVEGRNRAIEAGATRAWVDLVDDVVQTCEAVDRAYAACDDWTGTVSFLMGDRPKDMLPFLRQREVEVHRCDLGLGYRFADMPADYVRKELRLMEMLWKARKPMGMTPLPGEALAAQPSTRLAWMMGRTTIDGLEPAGLF